MKITSVKSREVIDSRGNPTVEVDVVADGGRGQEEDADGATHRRIILLPENRAIVCCSGSGASPWKPERQNQN